MSHWQLWWMPVLQELDVGWSNKSWCSMIHTIHGSYPVIPLVSTSPDATPLIHTSQIFLTFSDVGSTKYTAGTSGREDRSCESSLPMVSQILILLVPSKTYICTVTPFSRKSLTRIIEEMISWPNLSKIRAFQSMPPFSLLFEEVEASDVSKALSAWVAFRLSIDATAAGYI